MSSYAEVVAAIDQVTRATGDVDSWKIDLDPTITDLTVLAQRPQVWDVVLESLWRRYPTLFDPLTHLPVSGLPGTRDVGPAPLQGDGAEAIRTAEAALTKQHSTVAMLDLQVITAVLSAHATTAAGARALAALQRDIESAVRTRTDLDTPAGARDFQRYLIGKLREIGAVVEAAGLDATSKATLAGAWNALYDAATGPATPGPEPDPPVAPQRPAPPAAPGPQASPAGPGGLPPGELAPYDELPPYGELPGELPPYGDIPPYADLPPETVAPAAAPPVNTGAAAPAPAPASALPLPALPSLGGPIGGESAAAPSGSLRPAGLDALFGPEPPLAEDLPGQRSTAEDLDPDEPDADESDPDESDRADADRGDADPGEQPEPPRTVELPGGDRISVADPKLAAALTATLAGTPLREAFTAQGIVLPEPGSPVPQPLDPGRIRTGDIAVFSDRLAVALDDTRAWHDGQIQPIANVSGPSFLGWQHLPTVGAAAVPPGQPGQTPAPTRPAA